ncbi:type II toxin-antitoxin system RelE family toxin [Peptococcus simiae]|uniref:type II toxin-antitoxin system RelE family toxin n=1 Tax=Peptococcus simiae TaxID=1643805 RepID=UPI00397FD672
MSYELVLTRNAEKKLSQLDKTTRKRIALWLAKHLQNTEEPRVHGKALKGHLTDYWRYRIGDYRIIARIEDETLIILVVEIGHRKDIYRS